MGTWGESVDPDQLGFCPLGFRRPSKPSSLLPKLQDPDLRDFQSKLVLRKPDTPGDVPYIQEIDVVVRRLDLDGTLTYEELPHRRGGRLTAKKDEYVYLHPPAWKYHFFPKYTIMNKVFEKPQSRNPASFLLLNPVSSTFTQPNS